MALVYLDSLDDPRLTPYRDLPGRPACDGESRFVVEGRFLVERLIDSRLVTESVVTDVTRVSTLPAGIASETAVLVLPASAIDDLVGFEFHRGMLACGMRPRLPAVDEVVPALTESALLVVCSQVSDPTNLGGVMRNCAAFGADAVLLGPGCADPFARRVLRVSMGTVLNLPIARSRDLTKDLRRLTDQHHVTLVATVLDDGAEPLSRVEPLARVGLLIGNEGFGLSHDVIAMCQRKLTIPIVGSVDSLNVAVASGVVLYHFSRRG